MKNIKGLLIKINREKLELKQEYLCNGICAVSYLSKIEKGDIIPSDDIMEKLFEKLDLIYCMDEAFISKGKEIFEEIYKSSLIGVTVAPNKLEFIKNNKELILNSPLYIDYLLYSLFEEDYELEKSEVHILKYKEYMDREQLYKAYLITGVINDDFHLVEEAKNIKYTPEIINQMGILKWLSGKYYEAIDLLLEALNLAYKEGYVKLQMDICLYLGHIYMDFHIPTMQKYYDQVLNFSKLLHNNEYYFWIHYHLGVAYMKQDYDKAEKYLLEAVELCGTVTSLKEGQRKLEGTLQKLCLLYLQGNKFDAAEDSYKKIVELNLINNNDDHIINELLNIMVYNHNFLYSKEYRDKLGFIYRNCKKQGKFSKTKFYGDYLIGAYKANRQYKEALNVTEYIYSYLT